MGDRLVKFLEPRNVLNCKIIKAGHRLANRWLDEKRLGGVVRRFFALNIKMETLEENSMRRTNGIFQALRRQACSREVNRERRATPRRRNEIYALLANRKPRLKWRGIDDVERNEDYGSPLAPVQRGGDKVIRCREFFLFFFFFFFLLFSARWKAATVTGKRRVKAGETYANSQFHSYVMFSSIPHARIIPSSHGFQPPSLFFGGCKSVPGDNLRISFPPSSTIFRAIVRVHPRKHAQPATSIFLASTRSAGMASVIDTIFFLFFFPRVPGPESSPSSLLFVFLQLGTRKNFYPSLIDNWHDFFLTS